MGGHTYRGQPIQTNNTSIMHCCPYIYLATGCPSIHSTQAERFVLTKYSTSRAWFSGRTDMDWTRMSGQTRVFSTHFHRGLLFKGLHKIIAKGGFTQDYYSRGYTIIYCSRGFNRMTTYEGILCYNVKRELG